MAWTWLHAAVGLAHDLPRELEGEDLLVRGYVASLPMPALLDPQFEVDVVDAEIDAGVDVGTGRCPRQFPKRLRLAWYDTDLRPAPGELWQLVVRLKRRSGFANPGGYDYEAQLFRGGVGATGYVRADDRNRRLARASAKYPVLRARAWIAQRIAVATTGTTGTRKADRYLGILQGLAVGDTQAMQPGQWRVFAATGTTHLMAISGLHISMVAALVSACGGGIAWLRSAQRRGWTAVHGKAAAGAAAAIVYSCLAGLSVPTQRTLIMLCIYFAARWWRRETDVANALGMALVGILLIDPFAPLAVGAWLSFVAVAVLVAANAGNLAEDTPIREFTRAQLVVTIGMLPLVVIAFGGVSLVSPLANALAIPLFTIFLVPLVLAGTLVAAISLPAGGWILGWASALLDLCWPAVEWLAQRPLAIWYFPTLSPLTCLALVTGCGLLVLPAIWPMRALALLLCLPAVLNRPPAPAAGAFAMTVLDVGQGLAIVVQTHAHTLVYDTGPAFRTGTDTGQLVVLPFLRSAGIRQIDTLMVSHGDLDHAGGMLSVLQGMTTRQVSAGPSVVLTQAAAESVRCQAGQQWRWDGVSFEVLHPTDAPADSDNDSSCVLRIAGPAGSALLTGDIEKRAESSLVARGLPQTDVVVVAHHGSRSSSTVELVARMRARLAIFSAGYRNRWNFPKADVVERWRSTGARTVSTIDGGAIGVRVDTATGVQVEQYRQAHRHYWSAR
jgi:competence protein ComEC